MADQDYFYERQVKLKDAYDHPRDQPAMRDLSLHPLPTMRLGKLKDKLIPRPFDDEEEYEDGGSNHSGSVRDHLGPVHHRGGCGGGRDVGRG